MVYINIDDFIMAMNHYSIEKIKLENENQYEELINILKLNLSDEKNGKFSYALGYFFEPLMTISHKILTSIF